MILAEKAAPEVDSTIASLIAGDAVLSLDRAPSTSIESIPKSFNELIHLLSALPEDGRKEGLYPPVVLFAVTTRPKAVVISLPASNNSEIIFLSR